jgi:uncharacterized protein (TIGR02996 family)
MMGVMSDRDAFLRDIGVRPGDGLPKLIYADWLDEHGDPRGAGLRWVVRGGARPAHDTAEDTWDWWSRPPREPDYYPDGDVQPAVLPGNLFRRLKGKPTDIWKGYASYADALRDLLDAWARCAAEGVDPLGD